MIVISENAAGCILPVRAQPGARKPGIVGEHANALKVAVTAPAQDGRANKALVELLCEALRLKRSQVTLMSGASARNKKFQITGIARSELETRIADIIDRAKA